MRQLINILHVEDDDIDAETITRAMRPYNIVKIIRAVTGEQALNILYGLDSKQRVQQPFIILLDLWLPGMTGIEFLRRLRNEPEFEKTTVIVLSGSELPEHRERSLNSKVLAYINKSQLVEHADRLVQLFMLYLRRRFLNK